MSNHNSNRPRRTQPPRRTQQPRRGGGQRRERDHQDRVKTATSPRSAAFDVLIAVEESDSYANLLLPPLLRERRIIGRDAAFATELTYGTLRMQGRYDEIISRAAARPIGELDPPIRVALRLGAHQLLATRVPAHAAVSETVALARQRIGAGPAQLVNAVLRRVSERTSEEWEAELITDEGDQALAITHSHPEWILRAFRQALNARLDEGQDVEESLRSLLHANNEPPQVHLAVRPGLEVQGEAQELHPGRYARTARYLDGGDPGDISGIRSGSLGVQDEGSQLVTLAALGVEVEGSDETWIDLCAGPGGKAALMASTLADRGGGRFVANELHPHRTRLVEQNLRAIPESVDVELRTADGTETGDLEPGQYDRVLIDAPCTGLGALRRRPESRWRKTPTDLPELTALQRSLLLSGLKTVRVGGVVAYITCSPHVAETSLVVKDALRGAKKAGITAETLNAGEALASVSREQPEGTDTQMVQLWPHLHGTDAMFLTLLRRTG